MTGPTIRRRQLGIQLQRLRETASVTRSAAAAAIDCSVARIGHIELGRNVPNKAELIVLARDHYGADTDTLAALENLRTEASKRGWWSQYALPEWLAGYVGLEHDAASLRCLELENIPGLLQTEQYMRALYTLDVRLSAREVDRRVPARLKRQDRLTGPNPLELTAVISQGALERCAAEPCVAAGQLAQLQERASWPNVELRVLPFELGLHVGMAGPFSLLSFPDGLLPDCAYQEYVIGGHVIDDESVVSALTRLFDELRGQALGANESLAMIAQLVDNTHE